VFFSNSRSKYFWDTQCIQRTEDNKRVSISRNCRITRILAVFFPSLFFTFSILFSRHRLIVSARDRATSLACVSVTANARGFNTASAPALACRVPLAGVYLQETCKNKFKITWDGFRAQEAGVGQTLTLYTPCSTRAFTAEGRRKPWVSFYGSWLLLLANLCYGTIRRDSQFILVWSNLQESCRQRPAPFSSAAPLTAISLKVDLQNKWQRVLTQHKIFLQL